ncbi:anaphase-promoting complex, cyclosome, subunit 4-domain-containing protein [Gilbertella persicaria]|uniref:anaphase-promoting complex, cyclosome, subunit 4-domain-containing protein n=1 Tax=Gilbertella persicaria TaxID=101096 RepID=UPI00221FBF6D|nr:anaphase-promoting complex, cyclosome, subunit 4-domain-containing protein [Gilbertella persicaria]KAI8080751.1 anaphase-promoting complex, cyclosome, subunit 4-domain-containing protein [Gilbertella persicaria]
MPEVDLIGTLATGNVTESLQEFFTDFLTPQKIKEWESTMTHGYQNSLVTACQYVLPACDRIQLELSKLLGYSLWTQRYGDFLETSSVETCIECIQQFVRQMLDYTKSLNILTKSFEAFIQWISAVSQKISAADSVEFENQSSLCEEPELVLTYLDTNFMLKKPSKIFSTKICVASISSFTLDGILLQNQPKQKIVSITSVSAFSFNEIMR